MSRSRQHRQCRRRGCTCRPRKGAQRRRYALANDTIDARSVGSTAERYYDDETYPVHVEPRSSKDRLRSDREFDRIADANRDHRG